MTNSSKWIGLLAAITLCTIPTVARAEGPLRSGDRVVFLGDSITEQKIYTRYVMNYFTLRYPGLDVTFRNAGWGGCWAGRGVGRLERDVLSLKPTVVTICYGMNDAEYVPFDPKRLERHARAMAELVAALRKANVRVVLLSVGCVDGDRLPKFKDIDYNATLGKYAQAAKELAEKEKLPFVNLHELMLDVQTRAKARDPKFTMLPDGAHPNEMGHAVMAYGALKALGCQDQAARLTLNVEGNLASGAACKIDIKGVKMTEESVTFTRTDDALPTYLDPRADPILELLPFTKDFNQYMLEVSGLKEGKWKIVVEGVEVGTFGSKELADGVNLSTRPGPWRKIGESVNALAREQEDLYYMNWREAGLMRVPDAAKPERDALAKKLGQLVLEKESARLQAVPKERAWKWTLTFVKQ